MFYRLRRSLRTLLPKLNTELFYAHDLEVIPTVNSKIPIRIELLTKETIQKIMAVKKLDVDRLYTRLERGDLCYVAVTLADNKVVSYHWVQEEGAHFIQQAGRFETMKKKEACIYHVRVADEYKGNRINGEVYAEILRDSKRKGIKKVWVYTNLYNKSNRKGLVSLGFEIDYKIYSLFFNNKFYQIYKKNA